MQLQRVSHHTGSNSKFHSYTAEKEDSMFVLSTRTVLLTVLHLTLTVHLTLILTPTMRTGRLLGIPVAYHI